MYIYNMDSTYIQLTNVSFTCWERKEREFLWISRVSRELWLNARYANDWLRERKKIQKETFREKHRKKWYAKGKNASSRLSVIERILMWSENSTQLRYYPFLWSAPSERCMHIICTHTHARTQRARTYTRI